jgi:excisionase family DNA binding protein
LPERFSSESFSPQVTDFAGFSMRLPKNVRPKRFRVLAASRFIVGNEFLHVLTWATAMTYTIRDICNRFGVHEQTVLAWIHSGDLKALNCGRSLAKKKPRWRITQEALDAFEALRTPTPPAPKSRRRKHDSDVIEFYKK